MAVSPAPQAATRAGLHGVSVERQEGVAGILLAAGRGSRFDPTGERSKLLQTLPDGVPVAAASARALMAAVQRVIAVVREDDAILAELLRGQGCEVITCADAASGMAASLVCGIRHTRDAEGWLIALADMPYVQPATHAALAAAAKQSMAIAAPTHEGRRGNPVAFGKAHLPALLALQGDQGARSILKTNPVNELTVNDPGILLDIDTPSDIK